MGASPPFLGKNMPLPQISNINHPEEIPVPASEPVVLPIEGELSDGTSVVAVESVPIPSEFMEVDTDWEPSDTFQRVAVPNLEDYSLEKEATPTSEDMVNALLSASPPEMMTLDGYNEHVDWFSVRILGARQEILYPSRLAQKYFHSLDFSVADQAIEAMPESMRRLFESVTFSTKAYVQQYVEKTLTTRNVEDGTALCNQVVFVGCGNGPIIIQLAETFPYTNFYYLEESALLINSLDQFAKDNHLKNIICLQADVTDVEECKELLSLHQLDENLNVCTILEGLAYYSPTSVLLKWEEAFPDNNFCCAYGTDCSQDTRFSHELEAMNTWVKKATGSDPNYAYGDLIENGLSNNGKKTEIKDMVQIEREVYADLNIPLDHHAVHQDGSDNPSSIKIYTSHYASNLYETLELPKNSPFVKLS